MGLSKHDFDDLVVCVEKANSRLGPKSLKEMEDERQRMPPEKKTLIKEIVTKLFETASEPVK